VSLWRHVNGWIAGPDGDDIDPDLPVRRRCPRAAAGPPTRVASAFAAILTVIIGSIAIAGALGIAAGSG
jgi:hypothetical protein